MSISSRGEMMRVGIFGITGAVGKEIVDVMKRREFRFDELRVFASERSVGKKITGPDEKPYTVENANEADFSALDLAFFAIGGGWPKENAPKAISAGCYVVDNSSTFRYDDDVPLVIPEINPEAIGESKLIANPNCTTAIAAIPLWEIHKRYRLKKVIVSTYQATSGAGAEGMEELRKESMKMLQGGKASCKVFQHPIPFNLIPHIDSFQDNGYTKEEMKVAWETQKIFSDKRIKISCTSVRVPIMRAHSESIAVETEKEISAEDVREMLRTVKGIKVVDEPGKNSYPMPLNATSMFDVEVGRIRQSLVFGDHGVEFFVSGDQLLKGAALNAVQIGELLVNRIS